MGNLVIEEPTRAQVLAMADGLLAAKQYGLAARLYRTALAGQSGDHTLGARVRMGLAAAPSVQTPALVAGLEALEAGVPKVFVGAGLATWQKTLPFLEDARFVELADRHADLLPLPNWHWNLQTALWAAQTALSVDGDFVELGVFRGHTTMFLAEYLGFATSPKTWFLYDTFEGIPADQVAPGWDLINEGLYRGTYSFEEVQERFAAYPNIRVIKGRVPEALSPPPSNKIAFLHIDMNNPAAEVAALDLLFERVTSGGVILLDDYCWDSARAQYDAEKAWFDARNLKVLPLPTGQGLFVKP